MSDPPRPPKDRPAPGPHPGHVAEHQRPGSLFPEPAPDGELAADPAAEPAGGQPGADAGEDLADHLVPAAWGDGAGDGASEGGDVGESLFPLGPERLRSVIESMLFASDKPLTTARIVELLEEAAAAPRDASGPPLYQPSQITTALSALAAELRVGHRGIELHEVAGGWQLRTAPENAPWVQRLLQQKPVRLSRAQIETLAIIAYRQPITRPEIDDIRGVDSGGSLKTLLERGLIRILGKKEEPGRPLLYGTTKDFLEFFNLRDLKDLPTLREYNDLSDEHKAKMRSLGHEPPEPGEVTAAGAATEGTPLGGVLADGAGAIDVTPAEPGAPVGDEAAAQAAAQAATVRSGPPRELIDQQLADDAEQLAKIDEMIRTVSTAFPLLDPTLMGAQPGEPVPTATGSPTPAPPPEPGGAAPEDGRRRGRKPGTATAAPAAPAPAAPEPFSDDDDDELSGDADEDREPEEL
jgi:segregation and condensation protein B